MVSFNCTYMSRNNNFDYRVVTFVEHCTSNNYLFYISQEYAFMQCTLHQLETKLIVAELIYITEECELKIIEIRHDGKKIDENQLFHV